MIIVVEIPGKGRGVVADADFDANAFVGMNHIIEIPADQWPDGDYPMEWHDGTDCIALGFINLINHSSKGNCTFYRNYKERTISCYAKRKIGKGEELTCEYGEVWFEVLDV